MTTEPEDDIERLRKVRSELDHEFKTVARLGAFLRRQEKRCARNIAMGRKLLETSHKPKLRAASRTRVTRSRRSA